MAGTRKQLKATRRASARRAKVSVFPKSGKSGSARYIASINPATLEEIGRVACTDISKIPAMFTRAREAQRAWALTLYKVRTKHILKMRDYVVAHAVELARIVSQENGKSRIDALSTEVIPCALASDWYANNASTVLQPRRLPGSSVLFFNKRNEIIRVPLGVVGVISPWNYPLSVPFGEVVMGLMAGNAVMLKVADATILVGHAIQKIVEAGELPDGLFHHIVGSGAEVSRAFFENNIEKIFFTGSVTTGKALMYQAAHGLTPLSLGLGGKDPMIVLEDADLERAANGAAWAGYQNAGQSCGGVERIYVHQAVYDEFVKRLADKTRAIRHGPDRDFDVEMGSMTTEEQLHTVRRHIAAAQKGGARIVAQSRAVGPAAGLFHPATLMTGVNHQMELMREETLGPVLPVMKFSSVDEAVRLANDSTMGLTASIWTRNVRDARKLAKRIHAGAVTINDHLYTHGQSETPWGGAKESGFGRTHGALGLEEMTHPRLVNWDVLPAKRNIWWYPFDRAAYQALLAALYFSFPRTIGEFFSSALTLVFYSLRKMFTRWKTSSDE